MFAEFKKFFIDCKEQDFAFYMATAYLVFSYMRPQLIYPVLDILPWTQLTILAGLGYLLIKKRLAIHSNFIITLFFFIVILTSSFNSVYPDFSLSKLDAIYIWVVEILFFTNCIKNKHQLKLITIIFFIVLFKMSFFGAKTWVTRGFGFTGWGIAGPPGFFANSGEFSLLMAMLATMSISFIMGHPNARRTYYILPITAVMTVMGASSRGGQLALVGGLLVIGVVIGKIKIKNILAMTLVGYLIFTFTPEQQKERFTNMGDDGTSTSRLLYWEKGMDMMSEYPLWGVGHYAFPRYFSENYSHHLDKDTYLGNRQEASHNSFIQTGSTLGYTGLICYVTMHLICLTMTSRVRKIIREAGCKSTDWCYKYSIGLDATLFCYAIGSFFMSVAFYPYIYFLLMFNQILLNTTKLHYKQIQSS